MSEKYGVFQKFNKNLITKVAGDLIRIEEEDDMIVV